MALKSWSNVLARILRRCALSLENAISKPRMLVAVALANKMARMIWALWRVRKSVGQLGCFPVYGFGFQPWIPLLEFLTQGAIEGPRAGLQHEMGTGF